MKIRIVRGIRAAFFALGFVLMTSPASAVTKDQCVDADTHAQALRRAGKIADARQQLRTCVDAACPGMVREDCTQRLDELERAQPSVVFDVKDAAGHDVTQVKVTLDGHPYAEQLDGRALEADPGEHSFTFEVAGQPTVTQTLVLKETEKERRERIVFPSLNAPLPPSAQGGAPRADVDHDSHEGNVSGSKAKRILGFVLGGSGLGLGGVAAYYGVTAASRQSDSVKAAHSPDPSVQATAHTIHGQAVASQTYGYVFGGVGIAALGTGIALLVLSLPPSSAKTTGIQVTPIVGYNGAGIRVGGTW